MYKMTDDGKIVDDAGTEVTADALNTMVDGFNAKFDDVTKESNSRRKKAGELATELETATATSATLQTQVDAIDDKNKVKIDELKGEINKAWETKEAEWNAERVGLSDRLFDATVGVNFATSKVVAGTVLPPDIAKATFGKQFNPDGSANDASGNPIYSKSKPGELAGFDEALSQIIDAYPGKDSIMKATGTGGSGGQGSGGEHIATQTSGEKIAAGLKAL